MSDIRLNKEILETKDIVRKMDELSKEEVAMSCMNSHPKEDCFLVPFCCATTLPRGFDLKRYCGKKNLIYDISCLHYSLEECNLKVQTECCGETIEEYVPGYVIKIIGCIKYIASAFPVKKDSRCSKFCGGEFVKKGCDGNDVFDNSGKGHVCCQGCVCVDKVIGCMLATSTQNSFDCPELTCCTVKVRKFKVKEEKLCPDCEYGKLDDQRIIKFSGCFVLPSCNHNSDGASDDASDNTSDTPCDNASDKPCNEE